MNIVWNTCKSSLVCIDVLKERRAPRGNRYRINEYDLVKIALINNVRPKNGRTSEVMANDGGIFELPVIQKLIQYLVLYTQ